MTSIEEEENEDAQLETKILNKLQKTIIIKKKTSDKQTEHINKLAEKKKGTKYVKLEPVVQEDIQKIPSTTVKIPKTKTKLKKKPKIIYQSETESSESSESESSESLVIIKKKKKKVIEPKPQVKYVKTPIKAPVKKPVKKKVVKAPVKKAVKTTEPVEPVILQSRFKSKIC